MKNKKHKFTTEYILYQTTLFITGTYEESEPGDHFHPGFPAQLHIEKIYLNDHPQAEVSNIISDIDYEQIEEDLYADLLDGTLC